MSGKKPVNPKPGAVSNIPNDNSLKLFSSLSRSAQYLDAENGPASLKELKRFSISSVPAYLKGEFLSRLAESHQLTGDIRKAYPIYIRSLGFFHKNRDNFSRFHTLIKLGDLSRIMENFPMARQYYTAANKLGKNLRKKSKNFSPSLLIQVRCALALTHRGLGQWKLAERELKQVIKDFFRIKDSEGQAYSYWALGTTQRFSGNLRLAEKNLRASLKIYLRLRDKGGEGFARCGLGGTLRMKGWARKSGQMYKAANGIFKKLGDRFGLAYSYCGMGNACRMQNQFQKGVPFMKKAIKIYARLGQKGPRAYVLWSLAQSKIQLGYYKEAWKLLNRADRLFLSVKDGRGKVYVALGRGEWWKNRNTPMSNLYFKAALEMATRLNLPIEINHALKNLNIKNVWFQYEKSGIDLNKFKTYFTIP